MPCNTPGPTPMSICACAFNIFPVTTRWARCSTRSPQALDGVFLMVFAGLGEQGLLHNLCILNDQLLMALDGTQYFFLPVHSLRQLSHAALLQGAHALLSHGQHPSGRVQSADGGRYDVVESWLRRPSRASRRFSKATTRIYTLGGVCCQSAGGISSPTGTVTGSFN